jgi:hypothetical protein
MCYFYKPEKVMMKHPVIILFLLILLNTYSREQEFTDSNLPIIIIKTPGVAQIVDNPRMIASMKNIDRGNGERDYLSDQNEPTFLNYKGSEQQIKNTQGKS